MSQLIHPTSNLNAEWQVKFSSGEGIYIYDHTGKRYIEGMAGLWCTSLGYGHPELIEAATKQMETLSYSHMFGGKTHEIGLQLADTLSDINPIKNGFVFFGQSGSDANDTLIKMVRYYNQARGKPNKVKLIARENAYHGVTLASAAITGLAANHTHFNLPFDALGILRVDAPHYYRNGLDGESEAAFCDRLILQLENVIAREGADSIAAMIAEPISGAGGVIQPPSGYFERVSSLLKQHDILLLDDEVICGFGRLGCDFGATAFGFTPDTVTLAKGLSSAYFPISASIVSAPIYNAIAEASADVGIFGHGFTYSGHPVGCAVALKCLEIYQRENFYSQVKQKGEYLHSQLQKYIGDFPCVGEIRGRGLIAGIQFVKTREPKTFFSDNTFVVQCQKQCEANGLILRPLADNTLAICPPLIISYEQIDELVQLLAQSVNQVCEAVGLAG